MNSLGRKKKRNSRNFKVSPELKETLKNVKDAVNAHKKSQKKKKSINRERESMQKKAKKEYEKRLKKFNNAHGKCDSRLQWYNQLPEVYRSSKHDDSF